MRFTSSKSRPLTQRRLLVLFGCVLTLLGCVLRVAGARGDLWLDEISSLRHVSEIHSIGDVFWGINNDNNHFLNSLYLYAVGPDHSPLVLRAFSILLGTLTVPAAGIAAGGRNRPTASALAMLLFAVSYPMVHYGSEARGYAGLILSILLSILFAERPGTFANKLCLGLSILFGCLSQLIMAGFIPVLVLSVFFTALSRTGSLRNAVICTVDKFMIGGLLTLATALCILAHMPPGSFVFQSLDSSTLKEMTSAYGLGLEAVAGLFRLGMPQLFILLIWGGVWLHARRTRTDRSYLFLFGLILLPVALFTAHPYNMETTRYYLSSMTVALFFMADGGALMLTAHYKTRMLALLALIIILVGNSFNLLRFYADGRGHYAEVVRDMTADGPATYGLKTLFGVGTVVDYYGALEHREVTMIPEESWCQTPPDWFILVVASQTVPADPLTAFQNQITRGPASCPQTFDKPVLYPFWGLSGWEWELYRRQRH